MKNYIDEDNLRKAISHIVVSGAVFECRILHSFEKYNTLSGYFKDADTLLNALERFDLNNRSVYITLNLLNPACYSRAQKDVLIKSQKSTENTDIDGYRWLFVDLDPIRLAGVSASDDELEAAKRVGTKVYYYLKSIGFTEPLRAYSGNGVHLLYPISLKNTPENTELLSKCLEALSCRFTDEAVKIDTVNSNPARICKLYGTVARKGTNTDDRPHRMATLLSVDYERKVNDIDLLRKLAAQVIVPEKESKKYDGAGFDLEQWLDQYSIVYKKADYKNKGTKYILAECPFDSSHKAPDSAIFQTDDGIGFKCFHNSCSGYHWHDFRLHFEPEAYDKCQYKDDIRIEKGYKLHNRAKTLINRPNMDNTSEPMFLRMSDISKMKEEREEFIKSGITAIDDKIGGLQKGKISVVSGVRASAKSTILSQMVLTAINNGSRVIAYSGELTARNFSTWLLCQAAGIDYTVRSRFNESYFVPEDIARLIAQWLEDYLLIYNNNYGNKFEQIAKELPKYIDSYKADLVILDNMMALDLSYYNGGDKFEAQKQFVLDLKNLAHIYNVHIVFVAHPRKSLGFLRLDDIAGSGDIANIVDNAFIIHRVNHDFEIKYKEYYKDNINEQVLVATNVIEIAKNRSNGIQDEFIPLWYEVQSKRLKNSPLEDIHYNWVDSIGALPMQDNDELF